METLLEEVGWAVEHEQDHGLAKIESMKRAVVDMEEEVNSHKIAPCSLVQVWGCFQTVELQEKVMLIDEGEDQVGFGSSVEERETYDRLPEGKVQELVGQAALAEQKAALAGLEEHGETGHSYLGHTFLQTPMFL